MSTRSNIILSNKECRIILYRHHDGYPAENGADILAAMRGMNRYGGLPSIATALLAMRYEKQSYEPAARPIYEITDSIHGDIEWVYEVRENRAAGRIRVRVAARPKNWAEEAGDDGFGVERWCDEGSWMSVDEFRELINKDRAEHNARLEVLKASSVAYRDYQGYPMIEKEAA